MNTDFTKHVPVGLAPKKELQLFGFSIGASSGYSLVTFLFRYLDARSELYYYEGGQKILFPEAVMKSLPELLDKVFLGFLILGLFLIFAMIYHYAYHYQGSRSIYLMKRLPDRKELYRRCMTLPLLGILISIMAAFLLLFLYYFIYMIFTPEQCIEPIRWHMLWRAIL